LPIKRSLALIIFSPREVPPHYSFIEACHAIVPFLHLCTRVISLGVNIRVLGLVKDKIGVRSLGEPDSKENRTKLDLK
jgi:hypothetical protein